MELFGRVRKTDNDIIKKVLTETMHKKRPIGIPRMRLKETGRERHRKRWQEMCQLALGRERWR